MRLVSQTKTNFWTHYLSMIILSQFSCHLLPHTPIATCKLVSYLYNVYKVNITVNYVYKKKKKCHNREVPGHTIGSFISQLSYFISQDEALNIFVDTLE